MVVVRYAPVIVVIGCYKEKNGKLACTIHTHHSVFVQFGAICGECLPFCACVDIVGITGQPFYIIKSV